MAQININIMVMGSIEELKSQNPVPNCEVILTTGCGKVYKAISDSSGFFNFSVISMSDSGVVIEASCAGYFSERERCLSIDDNMLILRHFFLTPIPEMITWLPKLYFENNSLQPIGNPKYFFDPVFSVLLENNDINLIIIAHMDSSETIDMRQERAMYVYDALVESGIDSNRLEVVVSSEPNTLNPHDFEQLQIFEGTELIMLTETFIQSRPVEQEIFLRMLNRCVRLEIKLIEEK